MIEAGPAGYQQGAQRLGALRAVGAQRQAGAGEVEMAAVKAGVANRQCQAQLAVDLGVQQPGPQGASAQRELAANPVGR